MNPRTLTMTNLLNLTHTTSVSRERGGTRFSYMRREQCLAITIEPHSACFPTGSEPFHK
jgi:hypothetical protein